MAVADRDKNSIETNAYPPSDSTEAGYARRCRRSSEKTRYPYQQRRHHAMRAGDGSRIAQPRYRRCPVLCAKNSCTLLCQMLPSDCEIRMHIQTARLIRAMQRYLLAFEAAARHGSFTLAGDELSLTQGAVSRQIKDLESKLGRKLFQRRHKQVKLNETGEKLFRAHSFAARHLADATEDIFQEKSKKQVGLSTSTSSAAFFLCRA